MENNLAAAILKRRSIYNLGNRKIIDDSKLVQLLELAVKNCPSAFNSQSSRVVILFDKDHQLLWQTVSNILQKIVPAENFAPTRDKIASFAKGRGTVLYFEDTKTVKNLQKKFPLYAGNFPLWAEQANGMLQYAVWILLADNNIGANLQHYNPLIDDAVKKQWNLPDDWRLIAQMPFGSIEAPAGEKTFLPMEDRLKVFGK